MARADRGEREMSQQPALTFDYSGAELRPLLSALLESHEAELKRLDAEIAKFTPSQTEAARAPSMAPKWEVDKTGNIIPKRDGVMPEVKAVLDAHAFASLARRETELWLLECCRTPNTHWQLTLRDLGRLYPEQTAREILAKIQAETVAPGGWFYRLTATLGALLLRRRQVPRLPASAV